MPAPERPGDAALPLFKALGDETRFRILELVRAAEGAVSVAEVADALGLHPNTVRPHLERLREVGVLEVSSEPRGTVGRPQHLYRQAEDGPPIVGGPRSYHLLSELLAALASRLSAPEDAVDVGLEWGVALAEKEALGDTGPEVLISTFDRLGFDPTVDGETVIFSHCPFRELAEAYPDVVCSLHRGLCEGMVAAADDGTKVVEFRPLYSSRPCEVDLTTA